MPPVDIGYSNYHASISYPYYSPSNTQLTFAGLNPDYTVEKNKELTINWTADVSYTSSTPVAGKAFIILQGINDANHTRSECLIKEVNDKEAGITLTSAEMEKFEDYTSLAVIYGKGYYVNYTARNKKTYSISFLSNNYSFLEFNN